MARRYFGTDGIRGTVGVFPITPDFVLKLGWAAGKVLGQECESPKILIGKDTRISGYMFESALEAGLLAAGANVRMLGPVPTPAVAYLTRTFKAQAGIVVSASHNPFQDNGIKFFGPDGRKLPDEIEDRIEAMIDEPISVVDPEHLGHVRRIEDATGRYVEFCKSVWHRHEGLAGMRIVVDAANGASYYTGPAVFSELGADVITIGTSPDGKNINRGVGSTSMEALCERVVASRADLGIAFDGDADRVMMVDEKGEVIDGDQLLLILADHLRERDEFEGGVVGTLMSNLGLEVALREREIPFVRANVGDRYVMAEMLARHWILGGESSGHIICGHKTTTGDGAVAALLVVEALAVSGEPMSALAGKMKKYPQHMINVRLQSRKDIMALPEVQAVVRDVEELLGDTGRVLLRPSGTEPLIRVMVEGRDRETVRAMAARIAAVVESAAAG
jgi:phosphoglucosamine mutase